MRQVSSDRSESELSNPLQELRARTVVSSVLGDEFRRKLLTRPQVRATIAPSSHLSTVFDLSFPKPSRIARLGGIMACRGKESASVCRYETLEPHQTHSADAQEGGDEERIDALGS